MNHPNQGLCCLLTTALAAIAPGCTEHTTVAADQWAEQDFDADGWTVESGDCNDAHADVYPGADELCDGRDNDCDGVLPLDEIDNDLDGYDECGGNLRRDCVRDLLAQLPADQRLAVVLKLVLGHTVVEVAEIMARNAWSVRYLLRQGRARMRQLALADARVGELFDLRRS